MINLSFMLNPNSIKYKFDENLNLKSKANIQGDIVGQPLRNERGGN